MIELRQKHKVRWQQMLDCYWTLLAINDPASGGARAAVGTCRTKASFSSVRTESQLFEVFLF